MKRMIGYHWAITGAATAIAALFAFRICVGIWAERSNPDFLEAFGVMLFTTFLAIVYSWVFTFLTAWPFVMLTLKVAETLKTKSFVYFIISGALTGLALSWPITALSSIAEFSRIGEIEEPVLHSMSELAAQLIPLCVACGLSGAGLFWWRVIRRKSAV